MRKVSFKTSGVRASRALRIAVIAACWHDDVVDRLLVGALAALHKAGVLERQVRVIRVPGSFELVAACGRVARSKRFSAAVALGCLIRGETPHFEVLADSVAGTLAWLNVSQEMPVTLGVLTCDNRRQALARSGGRAGNAGAEAAEAAMIMAGLAGEI